MRNEDHEDPKSPRPIGVTKKRTNRSELAEAVPVTDVERDRHRHV
jgi:hypothetical protein